MGFDRQDAIATRAASKYIPPGGYKQFLKVGGLKGKRIGILKSFFDPSNIGAVERAVFEKHFSTIR